MTPKKTRLFYNKLDPSTLLPTDEIIALAQNSGVDFGDGNANERIRYFIKLGLLPHAVRKSATKDQRPETKEKLANGEWRMANGPVGHLPYWCISRLVEIDRLYKSGLSYPAIAQKIKSSTTDERPASRPASQRGEQGGLKTNAGNNTADLNPNQLDPNRLTPKPSSQIHKPIVGKMTQFNILSKVGIGAGFDIDKILTKHEKNISKIIDKKLTREARVSSVSAQEIFNQPLTSEPPKLLRGIKGPLIITLTSSILGIGFFSGLKIIDSNLSQKQQASESINRSLGQVLAATSDQHRLYIDADTEVTGTTLFEENITAPNVIYDVLAGTGIAISTGQTPTIALADDAFVESINDLKGTLTLKGSGKTSISASGSTVTITTDAISSEADTLATVTGRGATTSTASTFSGGLTVGSNITLSDTNSTINITNAGTLAFKDSTNTLFSLIDQGAFATIRLTDKASTGDPSTCTAGDVYFNGTDATVKACTATNTWEALDSSAGVAWSSLSAPTADLSLSHSTYATTFTSAATTQTFFTLTGTSFTIGELLDLTGTWTPTDGSTNEAIDINITHSPTTSADNFQSINLTTTDATALGNTIYGIQNTLTLTGNAAKTGYAYYGTVTSTSTTADTLYAADFATSISGAISTGTRNVYGVRSQPAVAAGNTGGTTNLYGAYFYPSSTTSTTGSTTSVIGVYINTTGTLTTGGTMTQYGLYIDATTATTTGTTTTYGMYVDSRTNADVKYAAIFRGDLFGIGTALPTAALEVISLNATRNVLNLGGNGNTTSDIINIAASGLTTGSTIVAAGPSTTGVTDHFVKLTSDVGSGAALIYGAPDFSGSGVTGYGLNITATDATANANTDYGVYSNLALTGNAAKTGYAYYGTVTSTSTTADTLYGIDILSDHNAASASGNKTLYGLRAQVTNDGITDASTGTHNIYGGYFAATGNLGGTSKSYGIYSASDGNVDNSYGLYTNATSGGGVGGGTHFGVYSTVAAQGATIYGLYGNATIGSSNATTAFGVYGNITNSGPGTGSVGYGLYSNVSAESTTTVYGLYVDAGTGAGTEYAAVFTNGSVGIGDTTPAASLTVGSGDAFQVASLGDVTLNETSPSITFTDTTASEDDFILRTSGNAFDIRNSTDSRTDISISGAGAVTLDGAAAGEGTSTLTLTSGDLTITNGDLTLSSGEFALTTDDTTTDAFTLTASTLTSGSAIVATGSTTTGVTDHFVKLTSDVGSASALIYGAPDFSGSVVTGYGVNITATDSTANANTDYGSYINLALTGNAAKTGYAYYGTVTSTSTTADTLYGIDILSDHNAASASGNKTLYGIRGQVTNDGITDAAGTHLAYGGYFSTIGNIGGTSTAYGIYADASGADNNYQFYSGSAFPNDGSTSALCWDNVGASAIVDCTTPLSDYAEIYSVEQNVEYGDIVAVGNNLAETKHVLTDKSGNTQQTLSVHISKLAKSHKSYQENILGITSQNWANFSSIGEGSVSEADNPMPIALNGRVPVKVSAENGPIAAGDFITSSSTPGVGMKATSSGRVIGVALQSFSADPSVCGSDSHQFENNSQQIACESKILVFVNPTFYLGEALAANGSFPIQPTDYGLQTTDSLASGQVNSDGTLSNIGEPSTTDNDNQILTADDIRRLVEEEVARQLASTPIPYRGSSSDTVSETNISAQTDQALVELNGLLTGQNVSLNTLAVTGQAHLASTQVAGTLSVDGTLIIDYGKQINVLGSTLFLQNDSLAGCTDDTVSSNPDTVSGCRSGRLVDIGAGALTFDRHGNLKIIGTITARKIETGEIALEDSGDSPTVGSSKLIAGTTTITISTQALKPGAKVLVTPTTPTNGKVLYVAQVQDFEGFRVAVENGPAPSEIKFDWLIVNTTQISQAN